jgi:hypothetical protein
MEAGGVGPQVSHGCGSETDLKNPMAVGGLGPNVSNEGETGGTSRTHGEEIPWRGEETLGIHGGGRGWIPDIPWRREEWDLLNPMGVGKVRPRISHKCGKGRIPCIPWKWEGWERRYPVEVEKWDLGFPMAVGGEDGTAGFPWRWEGRDLRNGGCRGGIPDIP